MTTSRDSDSVSSRRSPAPGLPRRDLLSLAGRGALWTALSASMVALIRFLGFAEPEPTATFTLDAPDAYPLGALTPVADGRALVGRDERGLYALIATCTHLGCLVERRDQRLECPCHGSRFDANGSVLRRPAERPLAHAALSLDAAGRVVLHLRRSVDASIRLAERDAS